MASSFSYKLVGEVYPLTFDFSQVMQYGEYAVSATNNAIVMDGVDPNPTNILKSRPIVNQLLVTQQIQNGLSNVTYRVILTVTSTQNNVYIGTGDITVYDPSLV